MPQTSAGANEVAHDGRLERQSDGDPTGGHDPRRRCGQVNVPDMFGSAGAQHAHVVQDQAVELTHAAAVLAMVKKTMTKATSAIREIRL